MKAIPSYFINYIVSDEDDLDFLEFKKQVASDLETNQRVVLSVFKFIFEDSKYPTADMTDQYDQVANAIENMEEDELQYLDQLLHKYNLKRDYLN
ncbi:hypothetical protein [Streptococcus gordonii]|uniref:hypothetical protein n=1 Tax=Streptococcus gordonii TaxID=1302 RepID=UPI001CBDA160|nr:hypothetical protein [Streptococcus gordonii]MBZ2142915.1 hypothetical protein [Streptococcus gordonii]MBZ2144986.1 hypothetical protein [Streptococcus gordonii]